MVQRLTGTIYPQPVLIMISSSEGFLIRLYGSTCHTPAFERQGEENNLKFKASLVYVVTSRPARAS